MERGALVPHDVEWELKHVLEHVLEVTRVEPHAVALLLNQDLAENQSVGDIYTFF